MTENNDALLSEIFPKPSTEIINERFNTGAAACNGECSSGMCKTTVDL